MSKRLQVIIQNDEYRALTQAARRRGATTSELVREAIRDVLAKGRDIGPEERVAAVLRFARFCGPTADIDQMLEEIERGRSDSQA